MTERLNLTDLDNTAERTDATRFEDGDGIDIRIGSSNLIDLEQARRQRRVADYAAQVAREQAEAARDPELRSVRAASSNIVRLFRQSEIELRNGSNAEEARAA